MEAGETTREAGPLASSITSPRVLPSADGKSLAGGAGRELTPSDPPPPFSPSPHPPAARPRASRQQQMATLRERIGAIVSRGGPRPLPGGSAQPPPGWAG